MATAKGRMPDDPGLRPRARRAGPRRQIPRARQLSQAGTSQRPPLSTREPQPRRLAGQPMRAEPQEHWDHSPRWLRVSAGYAWRLLVLGLAVVGAGLVFQRLQLLFVAIFLGLVIAAVLRPLTGWLGKAMPRSLATIIGYIVAIAVIGGLVTFIVVSITNQIDTLSKQFLDGLDTIIAAIQNLPVPIGKIDLSNIGQNVRDWVTANQGTLANEVFKRSGMVVEVFTAIALAVFSSIFFTNSGEKMWAWFLSEVPAATRPRWLAAGHAAWQTFSGYTRGTMMVAATNGLFAGIGLAILRVPLAAPLGVLVFLGTFVPLIGAPTAMVIATVIALAAKGMPTAIAVLVMIVLIGQFEGHVLQPLVMGPQVKLHPVAVAISVVGGTIIGGVIGAVVAVPIVSVCWTVFETLRRPPDSAAPDGAPGPQPVP